MPPAQQILPDLILKTQSGNTTTVPPTQSGQSSHWSDALTFGKVWSVVAPTSVVKTFGWSVAALGAAVGLEGMGKAPWDRSGESVPISTLVDKIANRKVPELAKKYLGKSEAESEMALSETPAAEPEVPNRNVMKESLDVISCLLYERAGSLPPDINLTSPMAAAQTIEKFKDAIAQMPNYLQERYLLWDAMKPLLKDPQSAAVAQRFKETVEAIAAKKPVPPPLESITLMSKAALPDPVPDAPFSKTSANGQYYELKADAIPALKSYLTPLDVLLRVNGLAIPQLRLDNARSAMGTLFDYSDALRKLDRNHPEISRVRRIGDGLGRSALTTETIKELKEQHTLAKALEAEYQAALPQLSPLLGTLLDKISSGLEVSGQKVPERHLKTIPAAVETLLRFQKAVRRIAPESSDVSMLGDIAAGLWTAPKDQVDGLKAFLDMKDKPSPASKPPPPASNTDLPKPPVPGAELEEPPVPIKTPPETPARGKR